MATMTSRERIFAALEGRAPDRAPVAELAIDPKVLDAIAPGMSYEDFIDHVDMDMAACLTMADDPDRVNWVDSEKGTWRDKWGALQIRTFDIISVVTGPPRIETEADLDAYEPPDPRQATVLEYARRLVKRFKGTRAIAVVGEGTFAPSQYLRAGLENLLIDYIERPQFVKKLAAIGLDYHVELYRRLIAEGVEVVVLGDDYAGKHGTFMSPAHFEEFILPGLRTLAREIRAAGAYCIKHSDGDLWGIMEMLTSAGFDMLGPLEPAYMPLDEVRKYSGGRVGVMGNVDVDLLSRGSVDEVRAATRDLLTRMRPLGGHILSSGNTISSSVRPENFMAMLDEARR